MSRQKSLPGKEKTPEGGAASGVGSRLAELQGNQSLSEFARNCGIGESTMRSYLAGVSPSTDKLTQIAQANGVSIHWLATGEGPRELSAMSRLGLARDASFLFVMKRSTVPEHRARELMDEAFRDRLDLAGLEARHGKTYPFPRSAPAPINIDVLRQVIEGVEEVLTTTSAKPLPAKKAEAIVLLYEHFQALGRVERGFIERQLRLVA